MLLNPRLFSSFVLLCLVLFGCRTSQVSADSPAESQAPASAEQIRPEDFLYLRASSFAESRAATSDGQPLPSGILHFGTFEPSDPTLCAFLGRPSAELDAAATSWLVERGVTTLSFPIRLHGEGAPSWATNEMYVHCQEDSQ